MCFSAEASFTAGAVLLPAGVYCLQAAARKKPRLLPLAAVPVIFGLQQISEGLVWLGLERGDAALTAGAALGFLLPALAGWPFWTPLLMWAMETHPLRKRLLLFWTALSTVWFWVLYLPLLMEPEMLLTTSIQHHSIAYNFDDLAVYHYLPVLAVRILYLLTVTIPLVISSDRGGTVPALLVAGTVAVSLVFFHYAFVSVWCFFAAVLSIILVGVFYHLPAPHPYPSPRRGEG
jgi:hypothetical protein